MPIDKHTIEMTEYYSNILDQVVVGLGSITTKSLQQKANTHSKNYFDKCIVQLNKLSDSLEYVNGRIELIVSSRKEYDSYQDTNNHNGKNDDEDHEDDVKDDSDSDSNSNS